MIVVYHYSSIYSLRRFLVCFYDQHINVCYDIYIAILFEMSSHNYFKQ